MYMHTFAKIHTPGCNNVSVSVCVLFMHVWRLLFQ